MSANASLAAKYTEHRCQGSQNSSNNCANSFSNSRKDRGNRLNNRTKTIADSIKHKDAACHNDGGRCCRCKGIHKADCRQGPKRNENQ